MFSKFCKIFYLKNILLLSTLQILSQSHDHWIFLEDFSKCDKYFPYQFRLKLFDFQFVRAQSLSCVWFFVTPWTVACEPPLSMEFSKQEY